MLTQARLRELLTYDPETGVFVWSQEIKNKRAAGKVAGYPLPTGYLFTTIEKQRVYLHRLAFLWMLGAWPSGEVDHINRNRGDNRWSNLRDVSLAFNRLARRRGRRVPDNNGLPQGVSKTRNKKRFQSRAGASGKNIHLGTFDTPEEAESAYRAFLKEEEKKHVFASSISN